MRRIGAAVLVFLQVFTAWCQVEELKFKHYNAVNEIPQSSVITIAQGKNRLMWFGTRDGLYKYDGVSFSSFRHKASDTASISNNDILDLVVDQSGDIWIGTRRGLNKYNPKKGIFQRYLVDKDSSEIFNKEVRAVEIDSLGNVWIGTASGLIVLTKKNKDVSELVSEGNSQEIADIYVNDILTDSRGLVWVASAQGLFVGEPNSSNLSNFNQFPLANKIGLSMNLTIQALEEDVDGNLWIGTQNSGVLNVSPNGSILKILNENSSPSITNNNIRSIELALDGSLWIGTFDGINRLKNGKIEQVKNNPEDPSSLSVNKVKSIYSASDGTVWVGTYYGGLNMWHPANFNFFSYFHNSSTEGIGHSVISSIIENEKSIFFGTEGGGLSILDKKNQTFQYVKTSNSPLCSDNIKSIKWKNQNQIWINTFDAGTCLWDVSENKVDSNFQTLDTISIYDVIQLGETGWLFASFGEGLIYYDEKRDSITRVMKSEANGLSHDQVRSLLKDRNEGIWVATQKGLNYIENFDLEAVNQKVKHFFYDKESGEGEDVLLMYQSKDNRLWVSTRESGLYVSDGASFKSVDVFTESKESSRIIHAIREDKLGHYWMSSNNGIVRYDGESGSVKLFTLSDGIASTVYNDQAALYADNGYMYFGSPNGVTFFNPSEIIENRKQVSVILTGLRVNNNVILPRDSTGILKSNLMFLKKIRLDYDQSNFSFDLAMLSYVHADKNQYKFRLVGIEDGWQVSSTPRVSYNIQKSGKYIFEVAGANNDGFWSDQITQLIVIVNPAPWRTAWAFILYGVFICVALFFLYRIIKSKAQLKYELNLEQRLNQEKEQINLFKLQFFTNISHEFRTPLTLILGSLESMLLDFKGSNSIYKQLKVMQQSAGQLIKLINQLMDFRKIENNQMKLEAAQGNIVQMVKEVFLSFQNYAYNGSYRYEFNSTDEDIQVYFDRYKLERILYNLISNAFKFTKPGGQVKIIIVKNVEAVRIKVADSGQGISSEDQIHIFERFYQGAGQGINNELSKGTGIGLALAKGMVELHKGSLDLDSEIDIGSTFTIVLPLGKEHLESSEIFVGFKNSDAIENYTINDEFNDSEKVINKILANSHNEEAKKILVVEDNENIRGLIVSILSEHYRIFEAENGKIGLEKALREQPDLIISDIMMPEMDGIELCTQIKSNIRLSHIPFILLTARTSLIFKYEGLESGADEYINKPFDIKELKLKVRNHIRLIEHFKSKFSSNDELNPSELTISSIDEKLLEQALQIVEDHIENEFFDVPLFCTELGVSRSMLFRKIKAWTNLTPNDFILTIRMKRAANLIEQNKIKIAQVGYKVGFKSPKYFSQRFQKFHGCTPTEFSKKFRSDS